MFNYLIIWLKYKSSLKNAVELVKKYWALFLFTGNISLSLDASE